MTTTKRSGIENSSISRQGADIFKLLTPKQYAGGDPDARWDTARNSEYSRVLAFYGLGYWYCFQVTISGS